MSFEVIIPAAGESVTSANVAQWHKSSGEVVAKGDIIVTLETDKVSQELEAEVAGVLNIVIPEGEEVAIGTVVATIAEGSIPAAPSEPVVVTESSSVAEPAASSEQTTGKTLDVVVPAAGESVTSANVAQWHFATGSQVTKGASLVTLETDKVSQELEAEADGILSIVVPEGEEVGIGTVVATITVGAVVSTSTVSSPPVAKASAPAPEVVAAPEQKPAQPVTPSTVASPVKLKPDLSITPDVAEHVSTPETDGRTTRKKMSMLRRKIATHLVNAQQTAAILTTFNEVDMTAVMELRKSVQADFVKKHDCKLGFMSLFVKAVVQALKDVPTMNGMIDGTDVVQNHFYDIGVAVGTEKGLVVPVIRDCEQKSFAEVEKDIIGYANKAREGSIQLADLQGGCFTISNGGVYGSLLSTPILNPPQSGILGMHTIQQRPVAVDGKVEIRPMMYLALSYDHRLVDGKEAVTFLIRIKDCLENPHRLMLEI